jgi:hypothetical protein
MRVTGFNYAVGYRITAKPVGIQVSAADRRHWQRSVIGTLVAATVAIDRHDDSGCVATAVSVSMGFVATVVP